MTNVILVITISSIDDDIVLVEQVFEIFDMFIHSYPRGKHQPDEAWRSQFFNQLFERVGPLSAFLHYFLDPIWSTVIGHYLLPPLE
jgi:hypothetical protein